MSADIITLRVTAEHIADGVKDSANSCAIALAVKQQIPGVDPGSVDIEGAIRFATNDGTDYEFFIEGVEEFIEAFDNSANDPEPTEFVLGALEDGRVDDDGRCEAWEYPDL